MDDQRIHFVKVTTDDRTYQLWAAATSRDDAVARVLDSIPEGWAARLLDGSFQPQHDNAPYLAAGEVREIAGLHHFDAD